LISWVLLTSMLLRRVTGLLTTPRCLPSAVGVPGMAPLDELLPTAFSSPSSLSPASERCKSFVPRLKLSRLDWISLRRSCSKYPPFMLSLLFMGGGDRGPGLCSELLPLLELLRLRPLRSLARWKLMREAAAGE
jgi:hypothetical protein